MSTGNDINTLARSIKGVVDFADKEDAAPRTVLFVTKEWHIIGHKGQSPFSAYQPALGIDLEQTIAGITGIPEKVLHNYENSYGLNSDEKLKWMDGRRTSRSEDMSYALLGILDVHMPLLYGERYTNARERLLAALRKRDHAAAQEAEHHKKIADWLAPPDPWTNHESARQRHEPGTGTWLLEHNEYLAWKSGSCRLLWLYGKAGCGKTVLCCTAIIDMRASRHNHFHTAHAVFYFSFSDVDKQTYRNFLVSLTVQLSKEEPGRSMLREACETPGKPRLDELRVILSACLASYGRVYLYLDGIDECPGFNKVRQNVLDGLEQLLARAPCVPVLITSRDVSDVRCFVEKFGAGLLSIPARAMDADIEKYVSTQLSRDHRLSCLDYATRRLIGETLAHKADGEFGWVYCQLQSLKVLKSTRPSSIKAALRALPKDLDQTYQRMLNSLTEGDRRHAHTLLRWLAYAKSTMSLEQLVEASITHPTDDPATDGVVDIQDRGGWEDTLEILAGLVTLEGAREGLSDGSETVDASGGRFRHTDLSRRVTRDSKIRLAHFSVKEYLESSRILSSDAKDLHIDPAQAHRFITQSCLVYLTHYSSSAQKTATKQDFVTFPLLQYAAEAWPDHALLQGSGSSGRELSLLTSDIKKRDWLLLHDPDEHWRRPFESVPASSGSALYYAGLLGLRRVTRQLLSEGVDVNAPGGQYGDALLAASLRGHTEVVQLLVEHRAYINRDSQGHQDLAVHFRLHRPTAVPCL
ncbi:hypothetical protein LTS10_011642 [Elasticomyces elasticus]|nr:hypothetical protein LTS10_011642 [Elasticomyces elasticus]